jgi:hypothetical protein
MFMLTTKGFRPRLPHGVVLLILVATSLFLAGQERSNEKEAAKTGSSKFVNVTGSVRCDKPDPSYSIEVPDRPGHALRLARRQCTWTAPMNVMGAMSKDGIAVEFPEQMEGQLHSHGFEVDTYDNGEKLTWQSMGTVSGERGPAAVKGRWSLMRGTGKFKGIKGGGTYEGKLAADNVLTLEFEGVYDPSEIAVEQK